MDIRNFEKEPIEAEHYQALRKEASFLCPHGMKFFSWLIAVIVITVANLILLTYGISFGIVKTLVWFSLFLIAFCFMAFIVGPANILLLSCINTYCMKKVPVVMQRIIPSSYLVNDDNESARKQVMINRRNDENLYFPINVNRLEIRKEDLKYNIKLRNLLSEIIIHFCFLSIVGFLFIIEKSASTCFSTQAAINLVIRGDFTHTIPFTEVKTYDAFLLYLNKTLAPSLLPEFRKVIPDWSILDDDTWPYPYSSKNQEVRGFKGKLGRDPISTNSTTFERGWTKDKSLRLLGRPRMRQVRSKIRGCNHINDYLTNPLTTRDDYCVGPLTIFNVETDTFTLRWEKRHVWEISEDAELPWRYHSAAKTRSLPIIAKFSTYPGGGYILGLARHLDDARVVLNFTDRFSWVNTGTRVVFIEFTLFNVNTNLFIVVTLIAERLASGYFIPSYQINSVRLTHTSIVEDVAVAIVTFLFVLILFFFSVREFVRIYNTSLSAYLRSEFAFMNVSIMIVAFFCVIFMFLRTHFIIEVLHDLQVTNYNEYISFVYATTFHNWFVYTGALLECLFSFKISQVLISAVSFYKLFHTITLCYKHAVNLLCNQLILIFAFALFFYLALGADAYGLRSLEVTFSTIIWRTAAMDDSFDFAMFYDSPLYLGPLFFGLFVVVVTVLFGYIYVGFIMLYFREVSRINLVSKYQMWKYIKHVLMLPDKDDVLRMRDGNVFFCEDEAAVSKSEPEPAKVEKEKVDLVSPKEEDKCKKLQKVCSRSLKAKQEEFLKRKRFDATEYRDVSPKLATAMTDVMRWRMASGLCSKKSAKEDALKSLFWYYSSVLRGRCVNNPSMRFFFVRNRCDRKPFDGGKLLAMVKVVSDFARAKGWMEKEDAGEDIDGDVSRMTELLCLLERKVHALMNAMENV